MKRRVNELNLLQLPLLVFSIVALITALFFMFLASEYAKYSGVRHGVMTLNCILWYFLKAKV